MSGPLRPDGVHAITPHDRKQAWGELVDRDVRERLAKLITLLGGVCTGPGDAASRARFKLREEQKAWAEREQGPRNEADRAWDRKLVGPALKAYRAFTRAVNTLTRNVVGATRKTWPRVYEGQVENIQSPVSPSAPLLITERRR